jgi:hypothetical protein
LNHVQIVDPVNINSRKTFGEQIRLLLIIAFEADPVARPDDGLEQGDGVARFHHLMIRQGSSGVDSRVTRNASLSPGPHLRSVLRVLCRLLNQGGNIGKKRSIIS